MVGQKPIDPLAQLVNELMMNSAGGVILVKRVGTNDWIQVFGGASPAEMVFVLEQTKMKIIESEGKEPRILAASGVVN